MVLAKFFVAVSLLHSSLLASGLDINELHGDVFPHRTLKQESKRQYVYGRVLPSTQNMIAAPQDDDGGDDDDKQFQMNSMFSSAMGSKLKRLVSHIDGKMNANAHAQDTRHGDVKKDVKNDNMMMSMKQNVAQGADESPVKRMQMFSGYGDSQTFSNHYRPSARRSDKRYSWLEQDQRPVEVQARIPTDVRRRRIPPTSRKRDDKPVFSNKNGEAWFNAPREDKKDDQQKMMHKKDSEVVGDFNFFNDDKQVMTELKRIFVDDDDDDQDSPLDNDENSTEANKESMSKKEEPKEQLDDEDKDIDVDQRHKELIDEYIRHMAQAMSVKKRSPFQFKQPEELYEYQEAEEMDKRLRQIEDLILEEANEIMEDGNVFDPTKMEHMIINRVNAARDLEVIRKSLLDLEKVMRQIRHEDSDDDILSLSKRGNKLANALGIMAPSERRRRYDEDIRSEEEDCPSEEMYVRDCSLLTNFLPDGDYKKYFRSACSDHQMCYVCMDVFGMSATECDTSFLREASTICENNKPCRTATKTMVLSNRKKRALAESSTENFGNQCAVSMCLKNSPVRRKR